MVKFGKFVLDPAPENRCKDPFSEYWRENRHARRGYDWSTDDPAKIDIASVGAGKLFQVANDAIGDV